MPRKTYDEYEVRLRISRKDGRLTFPDPPPEVAALFRDACSLPVQVQQARDYVSLIVPANEPLKRAAVLRLLGKLEMYIRELSRNDKAQ